MGQALDKDADVATCAHKVLQRVRAAGLGEALLDAYGERLIAELWRDRNGHADGHNRRKANGVAKTVAAASIVSAHEPMREEHQPGSARKDVAVRHEPRTATPGTRRVDVAQLASEPALLECIFVIGGRWVRLGDLTKRQCQALQRQYAAAADAFGKLAASLADDQIVRDLWTAQQLEDLGGDTLRGAASVRPIQ